MDPMADMSAVLEYCPGYFMLIFAYTRTVNLLVIHIIDIPVKTIYEELIADHRTKSNYGCYLNDEPDSKGEAAADGQKEAKGWLAGPMCGRRMASGGCRLQQVYMRLPQINLWAIVKGEQHCPTYPY